MAITVQCPGCGKKGEVPEAFQGKSVKCPGCGQQFGISAASSLAETKTGAQTQVPKASGSKPGTATAPKPATATMPAAAAGQQVGSGYTLLNRIGKGAYGEVWKAEAPGGVAVALKVLNVPPDHKEAKNELAALELIKKLRHPFLLQTQAYWIKDNRIYIAMELADGTLRDRLKQCQKQGGDIPFDEMMRCFREAAEALDWLHEQGVLHQDVKPENILLLTGHAKMADMGLARKQFEVKTVSVGSGTPSYMAPEAWEGKASPLSDQYSLAASYGEMRLHRLLFTGPNLQVIRRAHIERQPDLTGLSAAEQEVLLRALDKNPKDRFPTCKAFVEALEQAIPRDLKRQGTSGAALTKKLPGAEAAPAPAVSGSTLDLPDDIGLVKISGGGGDVIEVGEEIIVVEDDEPAPTSFTPGGPKAKVLDSSGREETDGAEPPKKPAALIDAQCPGCGYHGRVPDKLIGKKIKCRDCGQAFFVVDTREPEEKPAQGAKKNDPEPAAAAPPLIESSPFGDLSADSGPRDGGLVRIARDRDGESGGGGGGKNTAILVGSGVGLIVLAGIAIAIIAGRGGKEKEPDSQPQAKVKTSEKAEVRPPATEVVTTKNKDPGPVATKTKDPPAKPKAPEWIDAAAEGVMLGPVHVKVTAVEVDYVFGKKADDISKDKQLLIRLRVENKSNAQQRVELVGWGADLPKEGVPAASLRDDQGNLCKRIFFDMPGQISGQVVKEEFAPSVAVTDLLIFEVPKAGWKALYLELPAKNFGQTGELKFRIADTLLAANIPVDQDVPPVLTPAEEKYVLAQRKFLKDMNPLVRIKAAESLRDLGPKAHTAAADLGKALQDQNEKIRVTAAQALGKMGPLARAAMPDLIVALKDEFWKVQAESAKALGNIGPPAQEAIPKLKLLQKSKDEEVPQAALEAIRKILTKPKQ